MRNCRNFWIETRADGIQNVQATGPRGKTGCFNVDIRVRSNGESVPGLNVYGIAKDDGTLILCVDNGKGKEVYRAEYRR